LLLGGILAISLLAIFFHGIEFDALAATLAAAAPAPLVGVVVVTLVVYAVRSWRWGDLLQPLATVPQRDLFSATMIGFAAGLIIPRSGELVRPWLISRQYPVAMSAAFATIVLERLVDLVSVLALFAVYLFVLPRPAAELGDQWTQLLEVAGGTGAIAAVALFALLWAFHVNAARTVEVVDRAAARGPAWLAQRIGRMLHRFASGLAVLSAPARHLLKIGMKSALLWLLVALSFHLVHAAFGIDLPFHATFLLIAFLVVGESIPTPGLVGGFHAFYLLALAEVYGIDRNTAAAASIAAHALTNVPVLIVGGVILARQGLRLRRMVDAASDDRAG
jgi:hypothetical protein